MLLCATAALGATFVGMQAFEWTKLITEGVRPWGNPWGAPQFGSSFFMITGFHGCHVTAGVIYLTFILFGAMKGKYTQGGLSSSPVELVGLFWHFVDLVWILVFTFIYLL
jgi:cytochrome c oxidase subunit 3